MGDGGWDGGWEDEPTNASVFGDPHGPAVDPDDWYEWDDAGAGAYGGGYGGGHGDDAGFDDEGAKPNDPASISICIDDVTPTVGQKVTVTLKAKDPDAAITEQECGYHVAWDGNVRNLCRDDLVGSDGPRRTPLEEPGEVLVRYTHVFTRAEQVRVAGSVTSSRWEGYRSPYSSQAEALLTVTVHG